MMEFFSALAMLSSSSIKAVGFETADLSIDLVNPFLISSVFRILRRKQIDALAQSEQLLSAFSESQLAEAQRLASVGSWNWEIRNNTHTWSDELYRIYGLLPHESDPSYETFIELVHQDDRAVIKEAIEQALKTQKPIDSYLRIVRPDGAERIIHSRGQAISDTSGTPIRMHGTSQDVTERKQSEAALREAERKYRSIFENAAEGIFQTTPDGRFVAANPALARMLGFDSPEELMRTRIDIAQEHYVDPQIREEFKRSMEENGFVLDFELEAYRKDRSIIWVSENVRAVRDHSGTVAYYEGTTQDITGRKRAEEALRESEERYRDLVESSLDLICTHDLDGLILSANRSAMEIMGYSLGGYAGGTDLREILAPEVRDQFDDYLKRIRADGVASGLMLVQTKSGEKRIWEYHNTLRTHGVPAPIVRGMARDITDQKRVEEALRESESFRQMIIESEPECVKLVAPDYTLLDMNPAGLKMIEATSREQVIGQSVLSLIAPQCRSIFMRMHERVCQGESLVTEFEIVGLKGSRLWMESHAAPLLDKESRVIAQLAVTLDITERKRAEESLKLFRNLIDRSSDAIEVLDPSTHRLLDCNATAHQTLGYTREEFLSLNIYDIDPLADERRNMRLTEEMDRSGFVIFESIHRRKDGSTFPVEINLKIVRLERDYRLAVIRDITERKLAEEALHRAERKYRDIFENAGEGIFQSTPDGRFIAANPALARMHGFASPEELIHGRQDISQLYVDPTRREEFKRQIEEQGAVRGFEHQFFRKDGSKIWISLTARAVQDEQGVLQYYEGTAQDITDRKRAEEALRESEERYRELFENAKDAIYVQDLNGVYTSVNRAAEKLSGYDRNEIIGEHFANFVAPEYLPLVCANVARKLAHKEQTAYEVEVIAKDGRRVPIELSSALIFKHGVAVGIQGIARDITERKRAEDDLRQQKEILQKIFDHIPVMIRLAGPDGDVQLVNREYERTTGWSLEEIQKDAPNIFADLYPDKHDRQLILDRIATPKGEWADFRTRVRGGRVIDTSWTELHLSAGISLGIGQDISERKRAEETQRSYSRLLIEAQEAERQHIARELHDQIGQVLTAVRINLQTIWNSCETTESRLLIDQGVALIDEALEQVRNLSFELRPSLLDNLGLVAALRWYSDQYTKRTGIRTRSVTNLRGSQTRLHQDLETACFRIVQEALTNVVRHANAKNVSIDLRKLDHKIVLSIKDDGIGFDQLSPPCGALAIRLGLRGMKERALALGGTLEIKSAPAQGTDIRAYFPTESKED